MGEVALKVTRGRNKEQRITEKALGKMRTHIEKYLTERKAMKQNMEFRNVGPMLVLNEADGTNHRLIRVTLKPDFKILPFLSGIDEFKIEKVMLDEWSKLVVDEIKPLL